MKINVKPRGNTLADTNTLALPVEDTNAAITRSANNYGGIGEP